MIIFLSSFEGTIDSKNRISIPSTFRATIQQSKEKIYLFRSLKYSCLEVHLASKINALIDASKKVIDLYGADNKTYFKEDINE